MPKPFPPITLKTERKGNEDFNPAVQLFGRRFFADQTVAELLIELFLIATSAKRIGNSDVSESLPLPDLEQLRSWPSKAPLEYAPKVRLNLKLFSFLGASKLETRHDTHMQHYRELVTLLKRPDKLGVSATMDVDEVLKTLENLFLGLQSVGAQRTWCAQAFLPISKSLIAAETLWNDTYAKREKVLTWAEITKNFTDFFSFNKHRFLARGGELLYLQICNALRQDSPGVRKWLDEAGVGCTAEESDTASLHSELQGALAAVFDACPDTVGKLAVFLDSKVDAATARETDYEDGRARFASCGWCPEESWREGAVFAVELLRICQASIDPIERIELLEIACALQLLRSLCAQSARYGRNVCVQADAAGPLQYIWALSDPDGQNTVTKQISRRNLNAIQRMIYEALRDPAVRKDQSDSDYKEADKRYGHKLFLTVAKRIGLVVPKRGAGARLVLNDRLLRCMVLGTIRPGARVTYESFKKLLMAHYGLAVDAGAIARSCIWTGTAKLSTLGKPTDSWLIEMLDASGMLIRLSDSFFACRQPIRRRGHSIVILFAQSAFSYIRRQLDGRAAANGKLLFMMPSLPPAVVLEIGNSLLTYCTREPEMAPPVIRVSMPLANEWQTSDDATCRELGEEVSAHGWRDDKGSLTHYRNLIPEGNSLLSVLLIGVDRVTDSSSMEDFHQCSLENIWREELSSTFSSWCIAVLEDVGYDDNNIIRFDAILNALVERGLSDVLQISTFLEGLNFAGAQDGLDAERILLTSLNRFGLPFLGNFRSSNIRTIGTYIDDALAFFSYDSFLDDRNRDKALRSINEFQRKLSDVAFDPLDRRTFSDDEAFIIGIRDYVSTGNNELRNRLLQCDFVSIRDTVLSYRAPKAPKDPKPTIRKIAGAPIEVILSAVWDTLSDFRRSADDLGLFAHEELKSIDVEARLFKHDCDGDSPQERRFNALVYLRRLLGGVDFTVENHLQNSPLGGDERQIRCRLVKEDLDCQSSRVAEPFLQFEVVIKGVGLDKPVVKQFAWRLPITEPYRVADELIQWAAKAVSRADGYCLPVFQVAFYEELMLAKDEEETRRVLLHCLRDERDAVCNLLKAPDIDNQDRAVHKLQKLAVAYDEFIQKAAKEGIHTALNSGADEVRRSYESACEAYSDETSSVNNSTAALLFRAFLLVGRRDNAEGSRWMWEPYEPSCAVTVLHPALIEMLQAQVNYLLAAFATVAASELKAPGVRRFRDLIWRGYVDLAAIQTPLSGLIKDRNRVLDTDVRGKDLIHRIGSAGDRDASLTTRLLLRYDSFEDDDLSDADLFRRSRESTLLSRILEDYRRLHPHADDGLAIAVYHNGDIQPVIAAVDDFLKNTCAERSPARKDYAFSVTVFSESSDDTSVSRWVAQWKDRWADSENQASLSHYRRSALSIAHRIVSPDNYYRQFIQLIGESLEVDVVFLMDIIRAGNQGNDFETVEPYDVLTRTLKFPILEKPFCALRDPSRKLQRARVLSNRQFRSTTSHAELMARIKSRDVRKSAHHVVLGYGDYAPWQGVVDALHQKAEWVICIDPNIDERLIAEKGSGTNEAREIIGFGSGVGSHGEANFTISTEQFRHVDVLHKLDASIREIYSGWNSESYTIVAQKVLGESQHLSGLSLVRATGIGQYIRDFMAYSLVRKLLHADSNSLCDQVISLDAYQHWFESAETGMRPDLLWIVARIQDDGRLLLDLRLIECKLAKASDAHLQKAREQLESGLRQLVSVFKPRIVNTAEDDRPDQRYWWLQLYRLIASKAEIAERDQRRVLTSLERLAEGDYDVEWRACAITFWTDQPAGELSETAIWTHAFDGNELGISLITTGSEFVRILCEQGRAGKLPWGGGSITFRSARTPSTPESGDDGDGSPEVSSVLQTAIPQPNSEETTKRAIPQVTIDSAGLSFVKAERVLLGTTIPGSRKVYWEFGHKELNNRHILIFGSSGMGKTYTIQCLLSELGRAQQNSLIVDYTNGFFDNQLEPEFKDLLRPLQHVVRREPLAINPFRQQAESLGGELLPETASSTAQRVSGVFSEVYNFGDQQKSALYQAVKNGLESRFFDTLMERPSSSEMTLEDLIPELESLAEIKGTQGQSANSVISKLRPFLDQNPFGAEDPRGWDRLFSDEQHRCHVIQLAGFMKDAARLVTEFSLIDLYWYYRGRGNQTRPRVVVLDEVQNLDHRDESPLAQLLREGRKFGFSLILATQIMSNLDRDEKDRLFLAAHKLFFRPADTELRAYAEIAAVTTGERVDEWVKKLAALKKGECYSLGPSLNESLGKLEVKAFRVKILSFAERMTAHE